MAEHEYNHNNGYGYQQKDDAYYSTSKVLAVLTLFPIGGICFLLSGVILTATLIGLTISTPLFIIFSPILVPAILIVVFTIIGFIASGVFGVTAFSSMAYIVNFFRRMTRGRRGGRSVRDQVDYAKWRGEDRGGGYVGQKVKDMDQRIRQEMAKARGVK
ncbi:oleosin H2-like [Bidens hawaiensis]|uniref:oleosin H2-like n=1 Tax=Bidens hawaiensis TaxID=980011 RepID=UPI0040496BBC